MYAMPLVKMEAAEADDVVYDVPKNNKPVERFSVKNPESGRDDLYSKVQRKNNPPSPKLTNGHDTRVNNSLYNVVT